MTKQESYPTLMLPLKITKVFGWVGREGRVYFLYIQSRYVAPNSPCDCLLIPDVVLTENAGFKHGQELQFL